MSSEFTSPSDEEKAFYADALPFLEKAIMTLTSRLETFRQERREHGLRDPIEHCKARIKAAASMQEKLHRQNLPQTTEAALQEIHDAAGIRVICPFIDDIYIITQALRSQNDITIALQKDYIAAPKPNGYRSYHMILSLPITIQGETRQMYVEVQLRTIAMDCWASLEHQLKYKHTIRHQQMIVDELKRCADEIASTDMTLQTIRDLINEVPDRE